MSVVTVACKLPLGIVLRVFEKTEVSEPMPGGIRTVEQHMEVGGGSTRVKINGNAAPHGRSPSCMVIGGFALTPNVPAEIWEVWLEQNQDSDIVKHGLIFAYEKPSMAQGEAKEKKELKSGMERIKPDDDIRVPKRKLKTFKENDWET